MRIVFAGTPEFAATALEAIAGAAAGAGWHIPLVLTQPDRPAGRGLKLMSSPVKRLAEALGIEISTPASLRRGEAAVEAQARLRAAAPDIMVVAAYGLILPQAVLDVPRAALNIHASLLPRWRGAAPVVRAIEAGDAETGITIMQMDAGLDTGPMLRADTVPIAPDDTAASLTRKLALMGARLIEQTLREIDLDRLVATAQPDGATYAHKVQKSEAWLDWSQPAVRLERQIRAFDPFPVAASTLDGATVRLWRARAIAVTHASQQAGCILAADAAGLRVACGVGELLITELQRAGGRRMTVTEFLAGSPVQRGHRFVGPAVIAE